MADLEKDLKLKIAESVDKAVARAGVPASSGAAPPIAAAVIRDILPEILNASNAEPWYQSRVIWGVLIAGAGTIVKPFVGEFLPADQVAAYADSAATAGQFVGLALALYGRLIARRPIGK